jgi:hypothetical protein
MTRLDHEAWRPRNLGYRPPPRPAPTAAKKPKGPSAEQQKLVAQLGRELARRHDRPYTYAAPKTSTEARKLISRYEQELRKAHASQHP